MPLVVGGVFLALRTVPCPFLWLWLWFPLDSVLAVFWWGLVLFTSCGLPRLPAWTHLIPLQGLIDPLASRRICMDSSHVRAFILIEAIRLALRGLRGIVSALDRALNQYEAATGLAAVPGSSTPPCSSWTAPDFFQFSLVDFLLCLLPAWICAVAWDLHKRHQETGQSELGKLAAGHVHLRTGRSPFPRLLLPWLAIFATLSTWCCRPQIVHVRSAAEYFKIIPKFKGNNSISHAFPSIAEAKVYCFGYGVPFPAQQQSQ